MSKYSSFCNALSSTQYSLLMSPTSFAVFLSVLPHCRIFSKSTATREWLTCILDILQLRKTFFKKKKTALKLRNQSPQWTHQTATLTTRKVASESASFCNLPPKKNFPREYFLAAEIPIQRLAILYKYLTLGHSREFNFGLVLKHPRFLSLQGKKLVESPV